MSQLKNCPFCGGEAKLNKCLGEIWVACIECLCGTSFANSGTDPINEWNKRVADES